MKKDVKVLKVKKMHPTAIIPKYQTEGAAGLDLHACLREPVIIEPGGRKLISTGVAIQLPEGYEAQIRPRSGLALKHGIAIANSPGTVDCDYRGEVGVILVNFSDIPFKVNHGDRIAQMVIAKYTTVNFEEVDELDETERGGDAFGSTGINCRNLSNKE
jgi:dUTP pyrophosphatase